MSVYQQYKVLIETYGRQSEFGHKITKIISKKHGRIQLLMKNFFN